MTLASFHPLSFINVVTMMSFTKTALAAYAIIHSVFSSVVLAEKGDNRLFNDSKSSKEPTNNPTPIPTRIPTRRPTPRPSNRPSPRPTKAKASAKPTTKPSPRPSPSPTLFPITAIPTKNPTWKPSKFPTQSPTVEPTSTPTTFPTEIPTVDPSKSPSKEPVTFQPAAAPSTSPITFSPSTSPTKAPSSSPTQRPVTSRPTPSLSSQPVTFQPTVAPSTSPITFSPSTSPSKDPSASPTERPITSRPTPSPSSQPVTFQPTVAPSTSPITFFPSTSPTKAPSASPTERPITSRPTPSPSAQPVTFQPTVAPSTSPITFSPSTSPTKAPSASPSERPITSRPTPSPSTSPSTSPTHPRSSAFFLENSHADKLITIKEGQCFDGNNVQLWQNDNLGWQQWVLNRDNTIESVYCPGLVLDIARDDSTCANGTPIIVSTRTSGRESQQWTLRQDGVIESTICPDKGIDIRGYGTDNGAFIHLWSLHLQWNQVWEKVEITPSPTTVPSISSSPSTSSSPTNQVSDPFFIRNPHTDKLIAIKEGQCFDGNNVQLWQNGNLGWQQWVLNSDNTVESVYCPGLVLDIARDDSTCDNGMPIIVSTRTSGRESQQWTLRQDGVIESTICPGKGIDIRGYGTDNGAFIHLWSLHLQWNQVWEKVEITPSPTTVPSISSSPSTSSSPTNQVSDPFFIRNPHTDKLIAIKEGQCFDGNNVQLWQNGNLGWQQWVLNSDNTVESVYCPGLVLDIARDDSTCDNGMPIIVSTRTSGRESQQWTLRQDGVTESTICPGKGIDIRGYGTDNGAFIHLWSLHLQWNQLWQIDHALYPTLSPSIPPSRNPTVLPTASPSIRPSSRISAMPSHGNIASPSGSPSMNPSSPRSAAPSGYPSNEASKSPSTSPLSNPSSSPAVSSSVSPSSTPTVSPSSPPLPSVTITVPVTLTLDNFGPPPSQEELDDVARTLEYALSDVISSDLNEGQSIEDVKVISIGGQPVNRESSQNVRYLENTIVECTVTLTHICNLKNASNGCWQDDYASELYNLVTTSLSTETKNWRLEAAILENASSIENAASLLTAKVLSVDFDKPTVITSTLSIRPSKSPSKSPSMIPMSSPSSSPSIKLDTSPSASPSTSPSNLPSRSPDKSPLQSPSTNPSFLPSASHNTSGPTTANPTTRPSSDVVCDCGPVEPIRQRDLLEVEAPFSFESPLRRSILQKQVNGFVIDESLLDEMKFVPPTVVSNMGSSDQDVITDVVSLGSTTRLRYLTGQIQTWGSHNSIRRFWGFTEDDDFFDCSSVSDEELESYVQTCKTLTRRDQRIQQFFTRYYGLSEGNRTRSNNSGWVCAQRRLGRAFGWLHSQYHQNESDIPDYLFLVDDDTFIDTANVMSYLQRESDKNKGLLMRAGCLFEKNSDTIPFNLPYGGFGLFLNKAAIKQLSRPIHCNVDHSDRVCSTLQTNYVGEFDIFRDGMSLLELFYKFSATKHFCMHSDWLSGYVIEFYLGETRMDDFGNAEAVSRHSLRGMLDYPMCGNMTAFSGSVRHCTIHSDTCHNQVPQDMEFFALSSYWRSPSTYRAAPILAGTDLLDALESIQGKTSENKLRLPNVMLVGAQTAVELADWLLFNHACNPATFDDEPYYFVKGVHFFDKVERYSQGLSFYAKRYEHCSEEDSTEIIIDATPDYFEHPQRIYDIYSEAGRLSDLKLIVILQEPFARESSLYDLRVREYTINSGNEGWFSTVAYSNGTIMSFENYAEAVLKDQLSGSHYVDQLKLWASLFNRRQILILSYDEVDSNPDMVQWRVTEFLDLKTDETESKHFAHDVPTRAAQVLQPLFSQSNEELYYFLDSTQGPLMEQRPFPRFKGPERFAYATVLGWSPSSSQNKLYLDAVRVLIRSLRKSATNADIIVLMAYHDPDVESLLLDEHVIVKLVNRIHHSQHIDEFEPWFVDIALAKLRAFELVGYHHSKLVSEGLGPDSPIRAGWMMIKPSQSDFDAMEKILKDGSFDKIHGWNHLNVPVEYPGWMKSGDESRSDWNFYGSSLEQGLLFHFFYASPKSVTPFANDFELLRLVSDQELQKFGLVHFYGSRKPWSKVRARLPARMSSARERWLQLYDSLSTTQAQGSQRDYVMPLTKVGSEQYSKARVLSGYILEPTSSPSHVPTVAPLSSHSVPTTSPTVEICECTSQTSTRESLLTKSAVRTTFWECVSWSNFTDSAGNTCEHYTSQFLSTFGCEEFGDKTAIPTNPDVTNVYNETIWDACCFCGGGTRTFVEPV
ncbi:hypothetical protein HJC23_011149 [Cyclotella cryptica]|uniref:Ricin B lectin domain-containing protein n=1 Tax=Cyclotella cryptica TaxID=29204 RepID=A0ABD3NVV0_9STRA